MSNEGSIDNEAVENGELSRKRVKPENKAFKSSSSQRNTQKGSPTTSKMKHSERNHPNLLKYKVKRNNQIEISNTLT